MIFSKLIPKKIPTFLNNFKYKYIRDLSTHSSNNFTLNSDNSIMAILKSKNKKWYSSDVKYIPYSTIPLYPGATVLNYGQGIYDGFKAYKTINDDIAVFRLDKNHERFSSGAERLMMPPIDYDLFYSIIRSFILKNKHLIPDFNTGSFYIRPLLFGSGSSFNLAPSSDYTFVVYGSPVGHYFNSSSIKIKLEYNHNRSSPLGVGNIKFIGNYAPCFLPQTNSYTDGYKDI